MLAGVIELRSGFPISGQKILPLLCVGLLENWMGFNLYNISTTEWGFYPEIRSYTNEAIYPQLLKYTHGTLWPCLRKRDSLPLLCALIFSAQSKLLEMHQKGEIPVSLVLSSKLIDVDFCLRSLVLCYPPCQAFYIPHYNASKNHSQLDLTLHKLPLEMPEFGLLGIAEQLPCRIFFGLTSSIVILIEMLLRLNSRVDVVLVYAGHDGRQDTCSGQLIHFKKLLIHYQQLSAVREKGINIVI
jgi:hypothetical protein